ncbi:hypothetical protein [Paramagnetospirillum kuznetsovii]|nr:hypothetical protein [Paramagnetospirillum kuznetsovii]
MSNSHSLIGAYLPTEHPIPLAVADGWLIRSALQKLIRRGAIDLAGRAALTFWRIERAAVWQRLLIIAYEDVGLGSVDAVLAATAATSAKWRRVMGDDQTMVVAVARMLAAANKSRSAEGLASAAANDPGLRPLNSLLRTWSIPHVLGLMMDSSVPLGERATAVWHASGVDLWPNRRVGPGDLPALFAAYRKLGVPEAVLEAAAMALRKVREPMFILFPLLVLVMGQENAVEDRIIPMPTWGDVPLCAVDLFSRMGKTAIASFAFSHPPIRSVLKELLPEKSWAKAASYGVFFAEGGMVNPKLHWRHSEAIERQGIEADCASIGFPVDAISDFIKLVEAELPLLHTIRTGLLEAAMPDASLPQESLAPATSHDISTSTN